MVDNGRAKQSPPYIIIAIVVIGLCAIAGAGVLLFQNGAQAMMAAGVITTFASTIIMTLVGLQTKQTHDLVNSTATELRQVTNQLARAEGKVEGIEQEAAEPAREKPESIDPLTRGI